MFLIDYLLLVALCQGFILAFFLLTSRYYKSIANSWLALGLILISTTSLLDIIGENFVIKSIIIEFFVYDFPLELLIYVPFYIYFKCSSTESSLKKIDYLLFVLPFLFDTGINVLIVTNFTIEEISTNTEIQLLYGIETIISIVYSLFLCLKAKKLLSRMAKNNEIKKWLLKIWKSTFILIITWAIMTFLYEVNMDLAFLITILYIVVSVWLFWIIYEGVVSMNLIQDRVLIQNKLRNKHLQETPVEENIDFSLIIKRESVAESVPKNEKLNLHFEKINELVIKENLFLNEDLGISDIAEKMELSSGYVSQIIKNGTNKNFTNWINDFRVSIVKEMLLNKEYDDYTILAIGLEAGFKSKSAFYTTFKKITGITPVNFRKTKS